MQAKPLKKQDTKKYYFYALFDKDNKAHRYVMSLAHQLGWTRPNSRYGEVVDLERLGRFIATRTASKKPLRKQSPEELRKTIYALEQVLSK